MGLLLPPSPYPKQHPPPSALVPCSVFLWGGGLKAVCAPILLPSALHLEYSGLSPPALLGCHRDESHLCHQRDVYQPGPFNDIITEKCNLKETRLQGCLLPRTLSSVMQTALRITFPPSCSIILHVGHGPKLVAMALETTSSHHSQSKDRVSVPMYLFCCGRCLSYDPSQSSPYILLARQKSLRSPSRPATLKPGTSPNRKG